MATLPPLYTPLSHSSREIRLLTLHPKRHPSDTRIYCSISHALLRDSLRYEALSYVWGEPDSFNSKIKLNGYHVPIRRNLLLALRALRQVTERVLWIDALCINQADIKERGRQVQLMGGIYAGASCVLSWLGTPDLNDVEALPGEVRGTPPYDIAVPAFEFVEDAAKQALELGFLTREGYSARTRQGELEAERLCHRLLYGLAEGADDERSSDIEPPRRGYDAAAWRQLSIICSNEYWMRIWVIQEGYLARKLKLMFGNRAIDWKCFQVFGRLLTAFEPVESVKFYSNKDWGVVSDSEPWKRLEAIAPLIEQKERTLETLVSLSVECKCKDRRDKIYGILGLASDVSEGQFTVNYTKSMFQIYCDVMNFYIRQQDNEQKHEREIVMMQFSNILQVSLLGRRKDPRVTWSIDEDFTCLESGENQTQAKIRAVEFAEIKAISQDPDDLEAQISRVRKQERDLNYLSQEFLDRVAVLKFELNPISLGPAPRSISDDTTKDPRNYRKQWWEKKLSGFDIEDWGTFPLTQCSFIPTRKVDGLVMFAALCKGGDDWVVGISSTGIDPGDRLVWIEGSCSKNDSFAILRRYNDQVIILGRASLASSLLKAQKNSEEHLSKLQGLGHNPLKINGEVIERFRKPQQEFLVGLVALQVLTSPWL